MSARVGRARTVQTDGCFHSRLSGRGGCGGWALGQGLENFSDSKLEEGSCLGNPRCPDAPSPGPGFSFHSGYVSHLHAVPLLQTPAPCCLGSRWARAGPAPIGCTELQSLQGGVWADLARCQPAPLVGEAPPHVLPIPSWWGSRLGSPSSPLRASAPAHLPPVP